MSRFSSALIVWYKHNKRELPWRETRDPYCVWVSEIILQQTRVNQGLNYYINFINRFPSIFDLANATEDQVLMQWQGLGYYSRARNMHQAAKYVAFELKGQFPTTYDELIKLKGVGTYTAAAISSICFNEQRTVVDGNVFRVLTRLFDISTPINSSKGKKEIEALAQDLNVGDDYGSFNQALMEFGAIQCTPKLPKCNQCIFSTECIALSKGTIDKLPIKEKKIKIKKRFLNFIFVMDANNMTIIKRRNDNDIWKGLYQFPIVETPKDNLDDKILNNFSFNDDAIITSINNYTHKLTHQTLHIRIFSLKVSDLEGQIPDGFNMIEMCKIGEYALPKPLENFCNELEFL